MKSFSELTGREKFIELLRWICVLPVAMLAKLVGDMLTYLLVLGPLLSEMSREGSGRWVRHVVGGLLGGAVFVIAGAQMAPRFRLVIAVILAVNSIFFAVGTHWVHHGDNVPVVAATVATVCGVAVVVVVFFMEKWKRRPE